MDVLKCSYFTKIIKKRNECPYFKLHHLIQIYLIEINYYFLFNELISFNKKKNKFDENVNG